MRTILGKKLGMTQVFDESGNACPVTVLQAGPCCVVQRKTIEKDGYLAVQLGFEELPAKRAEKLATKAQQGHFKNAGKPFHRYLQEVRVKDLTEVADEVNVSIFSSVTKVDVVGISKGKGFQGTIKRHRFGGGPASHGSKNHRRPASNGSTDSGRTFKGKKRPGHMGDERVTAIGLRVVRVDQERNLILVQGSVPGPNGRLVTVVESSHK
jgi:large subunit ribosomal protein L3